MQGIATVAAMDCDDAGNKPLCGKFGVQGFPTLKVRALFGCRPARMRLMHVC
jgi:hypothetical protein